MFTPFTSSDTPTRSSFRTILVIFGLMLGAGIGGTAVVSSLTSNTPPVASKSLIQTLTALNVQPTPTRPANPYNVIFAQGSQGGSNLLTRGPLDTTTKLVSYLPDTIKHINFISASEVIFIDEIDDAEHGKSIKKYDTITKTTETLATSQNGWGIDDVVVSPSGTFIAWWEVKFAIPDQLLGGSSRVFVKHILPAASSPIQLTDEIASETVPIHYPLFFDGQNRLYLDTFIPNGGGFYLGLSVVQPGSTAITGIDDMKDGDYLSDPELSPDGSKILFTAYDPSAPLQFTSQSGLLVNRNSNINPNRIMVKDVSTGTKQILLTSENGAQYATPKWASDGTKIAYLKYHLTGNSTYAYDGVFVLQLGSAIQQQITSISENRIILLGFINNILLWGKLTRDVGSLGPKYSPILSEIRAADTLSDQSSPLLAEPLIQYIQVVNGNVEGTQLAQSHGTIQFASFKPKIVAQRRRLQQNDPHPTTPPPVPSIFVTPAGPLPSCKDYCQIPPDPTPIPPQCLDMVGKCYDSPLYLYPPKEMTVHIKTLGAHTFSESPPGKEGAWEVRALPEGKLIHDKKEYSHITYSYIGKPQNPPDFGVVVSFKALKDTLEDFALRLGLNTQESLDFVSFWKKELPASPYYLVSFYPKESSQKIIGYSFTPNPDTFLQIIMYFKPLDYPVKLPKPIFPEVKRQGFVAVDWSGIIDE